MKLLIVDDSEVVRTKLIAMLSEIDDIEIAGQAKDGREAVRAIKQLRPDAVILDIRMPGASGIDILESVKGDLADCRVVILTNYSYQQYRKRCMSAGADYFFDKSTEFEKVIELMRDPVFRSAKRKNNESE